MSYFRFIHRCAVGFALTLIATPHFALAETEKRCGWYENPTPANHWLVDADGEWLLGIQGGYQTENLFDLPEASFDFKNQWVSYGRGSYGYGCACFDGEFDHDTRYVVRVDKIEPLALARCRADPKLPAELSK